MGDLKVAAFATLNTFRAIAGKRDDDTIIQYRKGDSLPFWEIDKKDRIYAPVKFWVTRNKEANNQTRAAFKQAVLDLFGVEQLDDERIPREVRDVLKADDYDGAGHPLSARRIRAVVNAITATDAYAQLCANFEDCFSLVKVDGDATHEKTCVEVKNSMTDFLQKISQRPDALKTAISMIVGEDSEAQKVFEEAFGRMAAEIKRCIEATADKRLMYIGPGMQQYLEFSAKDNFIQAIDDYCSAEKNGIKYHLPAKFDEGKREEMFALMDKIFARVKLRQSAIDHLDSLAVSSAAGPIEKFEKSDRFEEVEKRSQKANAIASERAKAVGTLVEMTDEQTARYDKYRDIFAAAMVENPNNKLASEFEETQLSDTYAILARIATGKKLPANVIEKNSGYKCANNLDVDRILDFGKGREEKVVELFARLPPEVVCYALSNPDMKEKLFAGDKPITRESIVDVLFPDDANKRAKLLKYTGREFRRKVGKALEEALLARLIKNGVPPAVAANSQLVLFGNGSIFVAPDVAPKFFVSTEDGAHVTKGDLKGKVSLYNVESLKSQGWHEVKRLLAFDIARGKAKGCDHATVEIGDKKFNFGTVAAIPEGDEQDKASEQMADEVIEELKKFCGDGNELQGMALGMGLTQISAMFERQLGMPGGEHAPATFKLTRDPETGCVRLEKKINLPIGDERKLSYSFDVNQDGTSELATFDFFRQKAKADEGK